MNLKSDVGGSLRFAVGDGIEGRWEIFPTRLLAAILSVPIASAS